MNNKYVINKKTIISISMYVIVISILGFSSYGNGFLYFQEIFENSTTLLMLGSFLLALLLSISSNVKLNSFLFFAFIFHVIIVILSLISNNISIFGIVYRINISIIPLFLVVISSYIVKNMNSEEYVSRLLSTFTIWLSLQTIGSVLSTYMAQGAILKKEISVSIGNSNFIASTLLIGAVYFFLLGNVKKSKLYKFTLLISILALGFTFSFGSIITFILILYYYYFTKRKKFSKTTFIILAMTFTFYMLFILLLNGILLDAFFDTVFGDFIYKATFKVQQLVSGNYEAAFAGRGIVYSSKLELISQKLSLGYGTNVESAGQTRSHNWILDSLIYTGITGTSLYLLIIGYVLEKIRKYRYLVSNGDSAYFALMAGIIHGLIEPNFFSKPFDFIWWMIALTTLYKISLILKAKRTG